MKREVTRRKKVRPLSITSVSFRGNLQVAGFQHIHIEARASVSKGDDPTQVLDALKLFVAEELKRARSGHAPVSETRRFLDLLDRE